MTLRPADTLRIGTVGRQLGASVDRDPLVGVARIDHEQCGTRVVLEICRLLPAERGVERRDAVLDVVGWYGSPTDAPALGFNALPPQRLLDTREAHSPIGTDSTVHAL